MSSDWIFKEKHFSWLRSRSLIFLVIILIPIVITLFYFSIHIIIEYFLSKVDLFIQYEICIRFLFNFADFLSSMGFFVMFVAYPLFTFFCPHFFHKYNWTIFEDTVLEYTITIKILKVSMILLTFLLILSLTIGSSYIPFDFFNIQDKILSYFPMITEGHLHITKRIMSILSIDILNSLEQMMWLVVASGIMKILSLIIRKDFRSDFAIGCIRLIPKKKDENEKIKWLIRGLDSYNMFVNKQLKININIFKIYSKIINSSLKERNESMQIIYKAFEGDKLDIISCLSRYFKDGEKEQFLLMNSFQNRLKQLGTTIGWLISAIIGIIGAVVSIISASAKPH
jgi:hypothetical protein